MYYPVLLPEIEAMFTVLGINSAILLIYKTQNQKY